MQYCRDAVNFLKEYICGNKAKSNCIIDLDYTTRSLRLMEKRLEPCRYKPREDVEGVFYWIVNSGWMKLVYCMEGIEYNVFEYKKNVRDHMSGLRFNVTLAKGLIDGKTVWVVDWDMTRYVYRFYMDPVFKC